jgi:hypothetical protein
VPKSLDLKSWDPKNQDGGGRDTQVKIGNKHASFRTLAVEGLTPRFWQAPSGKFSVAQGRPHRRGDTE